MSVLRKRLLSGIGILLAILSCEEIFDTPPQARMVASVKYSIDNDQEMPVMTVYGRGNDSIWINRERTASFSLPLRPGYDTTAFVLHFDTLSLADTIVVVHKDSLNLESVESGFYYTYTLEKILYTDIRIDSIVGVNSSVTEEWNENIIIYINDPPALPDDD